jgi:CHAT domain
MTYYKFMVRVSSKAYGEFSAGVISSPAGMTFTGTPVPDPLQIMALRSKLAANPSEAGLRALGTLLFETLFTGDLVTLLRQAQFQAQEAKAVLRIQLAIEPNELSALPWELLFDPGTKQFLALSNHSTLVRYLPIAQTTQRLLAAPQLRILALFPSPVDMPPIDIRHERHVMEEALQPLLNSGLVELITLEHATVWDMVRAIRERQVHILYYQGYVGFNSDDRASYLLLEDDAGVAFRKGMEELSYTLLRTDVRLAVINSCGMAAGTLAYDLVRYGIPGAVAIQEPLRDIETITFLQHFSRALAIGLPVDVAVSEGRRAMYVMLGPQGFWASPILVVGQPDAALFALKERP